jgi:spore coat polysaccharide biosynthesis predicted glycosyltransferase SpsG
VANELAQLKLQQQTLQSSYDNLAVGVNSLVATQNANSDKLGRIIDAQGVFSQVRWHFCSVTFFAGS